MIREFELCDSKLNDILNYPNMIEAGKMNHRMDGIDYSHNQKVISSIKNACSIN